MGTPRSNVQFTPNVVPMIDVMLVLLIIFMIITPLMTNGFQATMPSGTNLEKRPEIDGEVVLGIDVSGNYFLNSSPIARGALEEHLHSLYSAREDKILYFRGDKDLSYGAVQEATEIARRSGVRVIAAITEHPRPKLEK